MFDIIVNNFMQKKNLNQYESVNKYGYFQGKSEIKLLFSLGFWRGKLDEF